MPGHRMLNIPPSQPPSLSLVDQVQHSARMFERALQTALAILLILFVVTAALRPLVELLALTALLVAVSVIYLLFRRGHISLALHGLVVALMAYGIAGVLAYGSVRSTGILGFIAAVVVGGIFLDRRSLVATLAGCVAAIGALTYLEAAGSWPRPDFRVGPAQWIAYSLVLGAFALVMYYARTALISSMLASQSAEAQLEAVFRNCPATLVQQRWEDGRIVRVNAAHERMYGITQEESIGRNALQLGLYSNTADRDRLIAHLIKENRLEGFHATMRRRSGETFDALISVERLQLHDGEYAVVTVTDVSEQKRHERAITALNETLEERVRVRTRELEATQRELEAFAYGVSHDLKAPIHRIEGFVRLLRDGLEGPVPDAQRRILERVLANNAAMHALTDALLVLVRAGQLPLTATRLDLSVLAAEAVAALRAQDDTRAVQVDIEPALSVCADRALVRILLDNLVGNAWKFTAGRSDARIAIGREPVAGGSQAFYVRDNGAGFDMAQAHRLFQPLQRLHRESEFPGHGVGLAMVQRIVARHGGRVWAQAARGEGATFYFVLEPGSAGPA
jgi:PAS domain S-box-containing protein